MSTDGVDTSRRRFLTAAASVVGGVGAVYVAYPFLASMAPSERARAAGAPVEVDISKLEPGQMLTVEWRGKPVWIVNRTRKCWTPSRPGCEPRRSEFGCAAAAGLCQERVSLDQAGNPGAGRYLHPPGLLADLSAGSRAGRSGSGLEGRFLLSLPRFEVRSRRPRVQSVPAPTNLVVPPHPISATSRDSDR